MEEKPKNLESDPRETSPCHICGGTHYEWGHPGRYFMPEGAIFGFGGGQPLEARECLRCGSVQIFIKQR